MAGSAGRPAGGPNPPRVAKPGMTNLWHRGEAKYLVIAGSPKMHLGRTSLLIPAKSPNAMRFAKPAANSDGMSSMVERQRAQIAA